MTVPDRSPDEALAEVVTRALTVPASVTGVEAAASALALDADDPERCELAVAAVAALLYGRPELADAALVDRLADLLVPSLPAAVAGAVATLFEFLATGPLAARVWARVAAALRDGRMEAGTRERVLCAARAVIEWHEDLVGLEDVLDLAEAPALAGHRAFLLDHGVERFVFCAPQTFTVARLARIAALFREAPRYRHVLYWLAGRPALPAASRDVVARELAGRFPFHAAAAAILRGRPLRVVVVLNVGQGQGDDVVRLVPLLQGLLDANPQLSITLVTWRPYLYDCPRIATIRIRDDLAVEAALAGEPDGIVEFFQPEALDFTFRLETHARIERYVVERRPALYITGDLGRLCEGRTGGRSPFLHQVVRLADDDVAAACGLDQKLVPSIYDPAMRLLAELGLPLRTGQEAPATPSVLAGVPSADAERAWTALTEADPGDERRPVALVNPFGGSGVTKGFTEQEALLAAEITGLVDEGHLVVLLPNGQTWGRRATALCVVARLDPAVQARVRVAPDPAESDEAARLDLPEQSSLSYGDRVMRLFKYFATYADLVVTVEGWLSHLAYNLGRPFRLFPGAGSFSPDWYPRGRATGQRLVTVLSPRSAAAHAGSALLRDGDPPPLPHRPRKHLLELALPGLGRAGAAGALAPLRRAMQSKDADVRTWAATALGGVVPAAAAKADLLAALEDRFASVVREAADALLRAGLDCSRELGPRYRERLQIEADIARQDWDAVAKAGPAALPALFRAAAGDYHDVRTGAKRLLRGALAPFVPRLQASPTHRTPS
jgi:hypothetical protein